MLKLKCLLLLVTFFVLYPVVLLKAARFTNIKCLELDRSFATIDICNLKVLRRGIIAMNIFIKLYKIPVTNVSINLSLHKRANGYRPFLYNISVDFCGFMRQRAKYPLLKIFYDAFTKNSNINHTCPYDHDLIIDNFVLDDNDFRLLPLPEGDYMFKLLVSAYNDWKADVRVYLKL